MAIVISTEEPKKEVSSLSDAGYHLLFDEVDTNSAQSAIEQRNKMAQILAQKPDASTGLRNIFLEKAINDGYNHLVLNGTCKANLIVTPFTAAIRKFSQYGFESNKPTITLTIQGGTNGVFDNTESGVQSSLVYGGILNIIDLTVSQTISLNNGAKMYVDNSSLEKLILIDGSSAEVTNSTITCGSDVSICVYLEDSGTIKFDNVTVNHAGDVYTFDIRSSSSAEISNSTITHTGSQSGHIYVRSNSSVQFEDTTITSENAATSVEYNGFLNLSLRKSDEVFIIKASLKY